MVTDFVNEIDTRVAYHDFIYWGGADDPISFNFLRTLKNDLSLFGVSALAAQGISVLENAKDVLSGMDRDAFNRLIFELARIPVECRVICNMKDGVTGEIRELTLSNFDIDSKQMPKTTLPAGCTLETLQEDVVYWFFFTRDELMVANLIFTMDEGVEKCNRLDVPIWDEDSYIVQLIQTLRGEPAASDDTVPQASLSDETPVPATEVVDAWASITNRSDPASAVSGVSQTAKEKILHFIETQGPVQTETIKAQKFCSARRVHIYLNELIDAGKIIRVEAGVYASTSTT